MNTLSNGNIFSSALRNKHSTHIWLSMCACCHIIFWLHQMPIPIIKPMKSLPIRKMCFHMCVPLFVVIAMVTRMHSIFFFFVEFIIFSVSIVCGKPLSCQTIVWVGASRKTNIFFSSKLKWIRHKSIGLSSIKQTTIHKSLQTGSFLPAILYNFDN